MNDIQNVQVEMLDDGDYALKWRTARPDVPVTVYSGTCPADIDFNTPLAKTTKAEVNISGLNGGFRRYFYIEMENRKGILAGERRLPFAGTKNFRDLGGYRCTDGRRVKWGVLYRSGRLDELTKSDRRYFSSLNIRVICDFRREEEQINCPSRLPEGDSINLVNLPIVAGSNQRFQEELDAQQTDDDVMKGIMEDVYLDFARNQTDRYGKMLHCMLGGGGMLIHCTAGKDRTGFGTALILAALGASREVIMEDYLLTMRYFPIEHEMQVMAARYEIPLEYYMQTMRPVFEAHPQYLQAAFDEIEKAYGTTCRYLNEALGISDEMLGELRERFLEMP